MNTNLFEQSLTYFYLFLWIIGWFGFIGMIINAGAFVYFITWPAKRKLAATGFMKWGLFILALGVVGYLSNFTFHYIKSL